MSAVRGGDASRARIRSLARASSDAIITSVEKSAREAMARAQSMAPSRTGALRRSAAVTTTRGKVLIAFRARYAAAVHFAKRFSSRPWFRFLSSAVDADRARVADAAATASRQAMR